MKAKDLTFLICIGLIFIVVSCAEQAKTKENHHIFRYNESLGISGLDPAFSRTQSLIWPVYQIFNGLVEMDDELNVIPLIASSWSIGNNGKSYRFNLRTDVKFHDHPAFPDGKGRFVTAQDFVYSFERILDPKTMSPGSWVFSHVKKDSGFIAINDSTLEINLREAFAPFLGILSMPYCYVVPKEVVKSEMYDFERFPSGTGPFCYKAWREEEKLILTKNRDYFEKDIDGHPLPYLDGISISFIKDKQSEFMEFLLGNIDYLSGMHPSYKDELITRNGNICPKYQDKYKIITQDYLNTEYLAFLVDTAIIRDSSSPYLNKDLRKAINYGFDRKKMMKYLRNNVGEPATGGFVPKGMAGYKTDMIDGYYYDPDTAAYLLGKAGYPGGEGLEELVLTTVSNYLDLCEFVQFELQKLGIKLKIEVLTGATARNMVRNSNLPFFRASWIADYPDPESYLSVFYSGNFSPGGPNYTHFRDAVYDSLYLLSNETLDKESRNSLLYRMDQMVIDEAIIVPLFYDEVFRIVPVQIEGFESNAMNIPKLKYVKKVSDY